MQTDAEHSWLPVRWSDWISFLCTESSARPLAIVRICLGSYLVIYWIELASFLDLYFLAPPMLFLDDLTTVPWYGAIRLVGESTLCRQLLFVGTALASICLAIGCCTRLASLSLWWMTQSWLEFPVGQNSGDFLVRIAVFLIMLSSLAGHSQAIWSLDAWWRRGSGRTRGIPAWPLRLFQIQLVLMYFFAGLYKVAGVGWFEGEALYYVFQHTLWRRFDLSWVRDPISIGLLTYGTIIFELLLFPLLIWFRRWRPWVLLAGLMFHAGIWLAARVFVFSCIVPIYYLAFVDDDLWQSIWELALIKVRSVSSRINQLTSQRPPTALHGCNPQHQPTAFATQTRQAAGVCVKMEKVAHTGVKQQG